MSADVDWRDRFWSKVAPEPNSGCWLWTARVNRYGYGSFRETGRMALAHRVAWSRVRGVVPSRLYVLHRCDTPGCVNPMHLFLGTQVDNMRDRAAKGRYLTQASGDANGMRRYPESVARGERHPNAKLTDAQVAEIRAAMSAPRRERYGTGAALARRFGVSKEHVSRIAAGVSRSRHVI